MPNIDETTVLSKSATKVGHVRMLRIPNKALGAVLDQGKDSAVAVHMLGVKYAGSSTFTLNESHYNSAYGVSKKPFHRGLAILKRSGLLKRTSRRGRGKFAEDTLIDVSGGGYTAVRYELLSNPQIFAFVAASNLSPRPVRPKDIARRIGITSKTTYGALLRAAEASNDVAVWRGDRGRIEVARKGFDFGLVRNDLSRNDPSINDPTHTYRKEAIPTEKKSSLLEESHALTAARAAVGSDDVFSKEDDLDFVVLPDWKSGYWLESLGVRPVTDKVTFSAANWNSVLQVFAKGRQLPGHLTTKASHRQADEIAQTLSSVAGLGRLSEYHAMYGLAYALCGAVAENRRIRSFRFLAERLVRRVMNGDLCWYFDIPWPRPLHQSEAAVDAILDELAAGGVPINARHLRAGCELQNLERLIGEHRDAGWLIEGARAAARDRENTERLNARGAEYWAWSFLTKYIDKAKQEVADEVTRRKEASQAQMAREKSDLEARMRPIMSELLQADSTKWISTSKCIDFRGLEQFLASWVKLGCSRVHVVDAMKYVLGQRGNAGAVTTKFKKWTSFDRYINEPLLRRLAIQKLCGQRLDEILHADQEATLQIGKMMDERTLASCVLDLRPDATVDMANNAIDGIIGDIRRSNLDGGDSEGVEMWDHFQETILAKCAEAHRNHAKPNSDLNIAQG